MNLLNFDYETLFNSVSIWRILSLWNKKLGNISIPSHFFKAEHNTDSYFNLLSYLFRQTVTESEIIELNEENCEISDEVISVNEVACIELLEWHSAEPLSTKCFDCDEDENECISCKIFSRFIASYNFCKVTLNSPLLEYSELLDNQTIVLLGSLYFSCMDIESGVYIGGRYNYEEQGIDILFYTNCSYKSDVLGYYLDIDKVLKFFKNALEKL